MEEKKKFENYTFLRFDPFSLFLASRKNKEAEKKRARKRQVQIESRRFRFYQFLVSLRTQVLGKISLTMRYLEVVRAEEHRDPYTVTKGQWEGCPDGWNDGESVGGVGPFRLRQMGGSCLTMPVPRCWSSPGPCWDDVDDTDGRLELRILVQLELRRYGTLLLVIGNPPPWTFTVNHIFKFLSISLIDYTIIFSFSLLIILFILFILFIICFYCFFSSTEIHQFLMNK